MKVKTLDVLCECHAWGDKSSLWALAALWHHLASGRAKCLHHQPKAHEAVATSSRWLAAWLQCWVPMRVISIKPAWANCADWNLSFLCNGTDLRCDICGNKCSQKRETQGAFLSKGSFLSRSVSSGTATSRSTLPAQALQVPMLQAEKLSERPGHEFTRQFAKPAITVYQAPLRVGLAKVGSLFTLHRLLSAVILRREARSAWWILSSATSLRLQKLQTLFFCFGIVVRFVWQFLCCRSNIFLVHP